jgi:hypothetical protein
MKKLIGMVALAGMLASLSVQGTMLDVNRPLDAYGGMGGGEFTIDAEGLGVFRSFCLEGNEYLDLGQNYYYTVSDSAKAGGIGGGSPDPISLGTAWLYSQFRAGTLAGYDYTPGPGRQASALNLQLAIWFLEDESASIDPTNPFYVAAQAMFADPKADNGGFVYGVTVLNIWETADQQGYIQDQLALVPEPTTILAGALLLLPFGASTVRGLRRKH